MWKAVEAKVGKSRMTKAKREKEEREKEQKEKMKKKTQKRKNDKGKKSNREIEDLRWRESSKIGEKLVSPRFHKWIDVFGKKASKKILTRKIWDYTIDIKEEFVPRKGKMYLSSWKERGEICEFINKHLRKEYIRSLKLSQIALVFFIKKKNSRKCMVQDYRYLNK